MHCCGGNKSDEDEAADEVVDRKLDEDLNFVWQPTIKSAKKIAYVRQLERRYERLQLAYFNLSAELARLQACLRQIVRADACERAKLIDEVKRKGFKKFDCNVFPTLEQHNFEMGSPQGKQHLLMASLRRKIGSLQKASENLGIKEELMPEVRQSQDSLICQASIKASPSKTSKVKEAQSVKITNYEDKLPAETASTSQNIKPEKPKKLTKLTNNPKLTAKNSTPAKMEDAKKASSTGSLNDKTDKKSNQANTPNLLTKKPALSADTLSSGQSIISTRSASFKELRAKYQQNKGPNK